MATDEKKKDDGRSVWFKNVRLSFTESLKDKEKTSDSPEAKPKHGCNIILPSDRPEYETNKAAAMSGIRAACVVQWKNPDAWKDIAEDAPKRICYRKGEKFKNKENQVYAGYAGNHAITASGPKAGQQRPILLDRFKGRLDCQPLIKGMHPTRTFTVDDIPEIFYGGVDADVKVSFFGTEKGSRGVFASIEMIRSRQTGERMGGGPGVSAEEISELDDLDGDTESGSGSALDDDLL